jgi:hypoxanthine phosphoribosyltransferase
LNGAVFFYTDLMRHLTIDCEVAFLSLSSYADSMTSSGRVKLKSPLPLVLPGRDVIIVEDIIDTGETLHYLETALRKIKVKSYSVAALLHKPEKTKRKIKLQYVGFKIPNHFVIGYGLDLKQKRRNLRDIYQHIEPK